MLHHFHKLDEITQKLPNCYTVWNRQTEQFLDMPLKIRGNLINYFFIITPHGFLGGLAKKPCRSTRGEGGGQIVQNSVNIVYEWPPTVHFNITNSNNNFISYLSLPNGYPVYIVKKFVLFETTT